MCISPNSIKNPNYGLSYLRGVDTVHQMLRVPCGHCPECIAVKQMGYVQRVQMESINYHLFYCTITYNNDTLPVLTTSTGFKIRYFDISHFQNMIKRLRQKNTFGRPFRYFAVSELGEKGGRPHAHILFSVLKHSDDKYIDCLDMESRFFRSVLNEWSINVGSDKKPIYKPCCTYVRKLTRQGWRYNYDLHYIRPDASRHGVADPAFYVLKYMTKPCDREIRLQRALHLNLPEDEYERIWSKVRCRCMISKHFGDDVFIDGKPSSFDVEYYVRKSIKNSYGESFPMFFNPDSGASFPLSRYYKRRFFTVDDLPYFPDANNCPEREDKSYSQLIKTVSDYEKIRKTLQNSDIFDSGFLDF